MTRWEEGNEEHRPNKFKELKDSLKSKRKGKMVKIEPDSTENGLFLPEKNQGIFNFH